MSGGSAPRGAGARVGEAVSKIEHIAGVPLEPESARALHEVYLAKGALATTAIEGNTLSEEEVREHLKGRKFRARKNLILTFLPARVQAEAGQTKQANRPMRR